MPKVIVTAQVEDSANWENGFRSHAGLFNNYPATDDNEVAILWDVANLDRYLELMDSPGTAEAMAQDGVKRETVKVYVLDKEINL